MVLPGQQVQARSLLRQPLQVDAEPKDALRSLERKALCVSLARSECALRSLLTGHKGDVTHFCGTDWFVHWVSPFVKMA